MTNVHCSRGGASTKSFTTACESKYAAIWKKSTKAEFAGLVAAGKFSEVTEVPVRYNSGRVLSNGRGSK